MKKIVLIVALFLGTYLVSAQAPEKMSYQAIIRNNSGQLLTNQNVAVRVSVLEGSVTGTTVYSERITGTTNANGLVSMEIGSGTVLSGLLNIINWGGSSYYLKTETDPTGGTNYTITGTSQLLSVPYALYAKSAGGSSSFTLPYTSAQTNTLDLFTLTNNGKGSAVTGRNEGGGYGVSGILASDTSGTGAAVYGQVANNSKGWAGKFENLDTNSNISALEVSTFGNGYAGDFIINKTNSAASALHAKINTSQTLGATTAAVYAESTGVGGQAGYFWQKNTASQKPAVTVRSEGEGNGIEIISKNTADALVAASDGTGTAVYGYATGTGEAGNFINYHNSNSKPVLTAITKGTGNVLLIQHTGTSGNLAVFQNNGSNVARISKTGVGYFNGGTQNSGADVAEAFDAAGDISQYEAGDILVISTDSDRTVEKSSQPYSNLVAGVYATKPGVLLTEEDINVDISGKVPMGVIGVIPTKVCLEGGSIKRGDLLVTSSTSGVAMKADPEKVRIGQVLGKALQDYDCQSVGKIKVLVSVK